MGAAFTWTFDQAFAGNVAPDAEVTNTSRQETRATGVEPNAD